MCIVSNTYRIGKVRIEYVSYWQGPYRIRIVSAADRIEYVSYRQGPYRIRIVSAADRIQYVSYRQGPYRPSPTRKLQEVLTRNCVCR